MGAPSTANPPPNRRPQKEVTQSHILEAATEAVNALKTTLSDPDASPATKVGVAKSLINMAYGKDFFQIENEKSDQAKLLADELARLRNPQSLWAAYDSYIKGGGFDPRCLTTLHDFVFFVEGERVE